MSKCIAINLEFLRKILLPTEVKEFYRLIHNVSVIKFERRALLKGVVVRVSTLSQSTIKGMLERNAINTTNRLIVLVKHYDYC